MPRAEPVADASRARRPARTRDERVRNAIALTIVALVFALPLRGLLRAPGPPMEEGFMLVFPEQVLKGAIPNRDFLHLYGPGSLWALAGVFKVFGVSLLSERGFGLLQQLAIVFGVYALARRWGRILAVARRGHVGAHHHPVRPDRAGVGRRRRARGVRPRRGHRGARRDRRRRGRAAGRCVAGLLLGLAVLFRLDLVLGVGLASIALVRGHGPSARVKRLLDRVRDRASRRTSIQIATAGPGHAFQGMVIDPVFQLRGGRSLPDPAAVGTLRRLPAKGGRARRRSSWPFPALARPHQLFLWFFLLLGAIAFVLWQGWQRDARRSRRRSRARTLFVVGLFGLGILPQAMQRVDSGHFSWVSCVVFAFVPIALYELARRRAPRVPTAPPRDRLGRADPRGARVRDPRVHDPHRTPTTRCRRSASTARRTRSSTTAASSTTASPTGPRPRTW